MAHTGALVVATPSTDDPIHEYTDEDSPHVTLVWFGEAADMPEGLADEIREAVAGVAAQHGPFAAKVAGVGILGPDRMSVLLLESAEMVAIRNEICTEDAVRRGWQLADRQFPWWICHLTVGDDGAVPAAPPDAVEIGGLSVWLGDDRSAYPLVTQEGDADEELAGMIAAAGCMIPPIVSLADLPLGLQFADANPAARWYVQKRAVALHAEHRIPKQWTQVAS